MRPYVLRTSNKRITMYIYYSIYTHTVVVHTIMNGSSWTIIDLCIAIHACCTHHLAALNIRIYTIQLSDRAEYSPNASAPLPALPGVRFYISFTVCCSCPDPLYIIIVRVCVCLTIKDRKNPIGFIVVSHSVRFL